MAKITEAKSLDSVKAKRTREALEVVAKGEQPAKETKKKTGIVIEKINEEVLPFLVTGSSADYVQHAFSAKSQEKMLEEMAQIAKETTRRAPRRYYQDYLGSLHMSPEGWYGIPCTNFKAAMVAACRNTGNKMTEVKQTIRILEDGRDRADGTPLVRILAGQPVPVVHPVRNSGGSTDLRVRAKWFVWYVVLRIRYDRNTISRDSVGNLLHRAGRYAGVGEGRASSKKSVGMDWGYFHVADPDTVIPSEEEINYPALTEMEAVIASLIERERSGELDRLTAELAVEKKAKKKAKDDAGTDDEEDLEDDDA